MPLLFGDFFKFVLEFLLFCSSGFMILLVLVQRGRGGGLTGALGGMGGQSAFGAKAGDVFTRITVFSAIIWIFLCLITIMSYTYVEVDTTAMKEYEYDKLLTEDGKAKIGKESTGPSTGTGDADISTGNSSISSSEGDKKGDSDDGEKDDDGDDTTKGEAKKDDDATKSSDPGKTEDDPKKTEDKGTPEDNKVDSDDKSKEDKSGEPKTESKDGDDNK